MCLNVKIYRNSASHISLNELICVFLAVFWELMELFSFTEAYLIENNLQPSEQDVQLEEFFWTGSGDGPTYIKSKDSSGHDGRYPNTIVRTATILATVYIDGNYVRILNLSRILDE
jgi:hypothetical protein